MDSVSQAVVLNRVRELIQPLLSSRGVELVELGAHPGGGRLILRCLVDTARGITLDELSGLNRSIGALLDEHDVIPDRYLLEVSSPGLDRPLKTVTDFELVIGRRVLVTTAAPVASRKEHCGEVLSASGESVVLRLDSGDKLPIPFAQIARAVQEVGLK